MRLSETEVNRPREDTLAGGAKGSDSVLDWRESLRQTIADGTSPVHMMGVGNELRMDDAAGLEIASSLRRELGMAPAPGVKIYGSTPAPERLLSRLASATGRIVVFDAIEASARPGEVFFRRMSDTKYGFFGTHNIPLKLVPGLEGRLDDIFLVGVQPASLEVGLGISKAVRESVREVVGVVAEGVAERS